MERCLSRAKAHRRAQVVERLPDLRREARPQVQAAHVQRLEHALHLCEAGSQRGGRIGQAAHEAGRIGAAEQAHREALAAGVARAVRVEHQDARDLARRAARPTQRQQGAAGPAVGAARKCRQEVSAALISPHAIRHTN